MLRSVARLLVASTLLLAGCGMLGQGKPRVAPPLRLRVDAGARINPDDRGRALPTLIRVYQLSTAAHARTVELTDLLRDPKEALGGDLLAMEELLLSPGESVERVLTREPETRAILVAAVVRRPATTTWRDIVELMPNKTPALSYVLEEYRLTPR